MPKEDTACPCTFDTPDIWRGFFDLWDIEFTPVEEAHMHRRAEAESGTRYEDVMVGSQRKPESPLDDVSEI